uniref:Platelet-activating factor acetylhydrolase plasma/intracellular isoform II n=1 Tax=uncultured bacterium pAW1 TaxID=1781155 RepID=A0A1C9U4R6_9BACT|nr:platelet-activating factor acetylhydrolase plasma/intracellular isoform II [uncultured bacterium pAW1]
MAVSGAADLWAQSFFNPGPQFTPDLPSVVRVLDTMWIDRPRSREIPVRIYYPDSATTPMPIVLVSHGLGGTRHSLAYFGRYLASYGYVCVHVQHPGSDDQVWRGQLRPQEAMRRAARDIRNIANRPEDMSHVLSRLIDLNRDTSFVLFGLLDTTRVAAAGHSLGAFTASALAGRKGIFTGHGPLMFRDDRIDVAIIMSEPLPDSAVASTVYAQFATPALHITGTRDRSFINSDSPTDRRIPFAAIPRSDQFLVIFSGADHMTFSGQRLGGEPTALDRAIHAAVQRLARRFLDGYLRSTPRAHAWMQEFSLPEDFHVAGTVERK